MKIFGNLLTRYIKFYEKLKIFREERWRKYCLNKYGVYCNADQLTPEEMLQAFWRILEKGSGHDVSNFTSNTSLFEILSPGDYDCADMAFIADLEDIFGFTRDEICKEEPFENFGELAELVIKKAKEKKQRQDNQP